MEIGNIELFLHYFGQVRERTTRVARCISPDKIDWSYAPGKFTRKMFRAVRWRFIDAYVSGVSVKAVEQLTTKEAVQVCYGSESSTERLGRNCVNTLHYRLTLEYAPGRSPD